MPLAGAEAGVADNATLPQAGQAETRAMRSRFLEVIFSPFVWRREAVRMDARRIDLPAGAKHGSVL